MRATFLAAAIAAVVMLSGCAQLLPRSPTPTTSSTPPTSTPVATSTPLTTPSPTPNATTTTPPTPSTPTSATPPANNSKSPPARFNVTHDYSAGDENKTFVVPDDGYHYNLTINSDPVPTPAGTFVCAGVMRLTVYAPNGTTYFDAFVNQQPNAAATDHCGYVGTVTPPKGPVPPGTWHAAFGGTGQGIAYVRVTGS